VARSHKITTNLFADVLAFDTRGQNAATIVRRTAGEVTFEFFELSPTTNSLFKKKGRLLRSFPGPAIAIAHEKTRDPSFREALAQVFSHLDSNTPIEAYPVIEKARSKSIETRDTVCGMN
jgi:hypothetical protein